MPTVEYLLEAKADIALRAAGDLSGTARDMAERQMLKRNESEYHRRILELIDNEAEWKEL